ncbi:MAG: hypothetical protein KF790_08365 [Steroidobacteraceae bacterium]|nr:hypothetical protein [Steroidobacteraceae bacterium]MCW5571437.1 hypothetical protein [Steroidobacteraceae bacterium]
MKSAWQQIWILSLAALGVWVAALVIARTVPVALAQTAEPPAAEVPVPETSAPADEGPIDDEEPIGAPVTQREEVPPELRQSADNNVSFPVDI